jgi:hypothetical protein
VHMFDGPHAFEGYLEQAHSLSPLTQSGRHGPLEGSHLEPPFDWTFGFTFSWKESPRHFVLVMDPDLLYMVVAMWRCTSVMHAPF